MSDAANRSADSASSHRPGIAVRWLGATHVLIYAVVLAAICWAGFVRANLNLGNHLPGSDFLAFYTGAVLARQQPDRLYDRQSQIELENQINAGSQRSPGYHLFYVYPPYFSVALLPLGYFPYVKAYWVWSAITVVFYFLSVALLLAGVAELKRFKFHACAIAAAAPALHWLLAAGQTTALGLIILTLAWQLLARRQWLLSGAVLALLSYRPQLLCLLLPLAWGKLPRRVVLGLMAGLTLLLIIGAIGLSVESYVQYISWLGHFSELLRQGIHPLTLHISLYGFFRPLMYHSAAVAASALLSALLVYGLIRAWRGPIRVGAALFDLQFAMVLPATLLLMHHSLIYDVMLITPVALLVYKHQRYFPSYYKIPLVLLYLSPWVFFLFGDWLAVNPLPPLLLWLVVELYRAQERIRRDAGARA